MPSSGALVETQINKANLTKAGSKIFFKKKEELRNCVKCFREWEWRCVKSCVTFRPKLRQTGKGSVQSLSGETLPSSNRVPDVLLRPLS